MLSDCEVALIGVTTDLENPEKSHKMETETASGENSWHWKISIY